MNTVTLSRGQHLNKSVANFTLQINIFVSCMDFPGVQSLVRWLVLLSKHEQDACTQMVIA